MKKTNKSLELIIALGSLLASAFVFILFSNRKKRKDTKTIDWISWGIKFSENATSMERAVAEKAIEKYLINHLYGDNPRIFINSIKISRIPAAGNFGFDVILNIKIGYASSSAVGTFKPKGPGPKLPSPFEFPDVEIVVDLSEQDIAH